MHKTAIVWMHGKAAGELKETADGYEFEYYDEYTANSDNPAVSLTLPTTQKKFKSNVLFSFFDGLIPEGWLLNIATTSWKIKTGDRMGLLLACCKECIGAVSITDKDNEEHE